MSKLVWSSKFQYLSGHFLWKNLQQLLLPCSVLSTALFDCWLAGYWCKQISAQSFSIVILCRYFFIFLIKMFKMPDFFPNMTYLVIHESVLKRIFPKNSIWQIFTKKHFWIRNRSGKSTWLPAGLLRLLP